MDFLNKLLGFISVMIFLSISVMALLHANRVTSAFNPSDPLKKSNVEILGHKQNGSFADGYLQMAAHGKMDTRRDIFVTTQVPIKQLLEAGEKMPPESEYAVFASVKSNLYAQKECEILQKNLASKCQTGHINASVKDDLVHMTFTLNFVEKANFGTLEGAEKRIYTKIEEKFLEGKISFPLSAQKKEREAFYRKVFGKCQEIRRKEGNCSITRVYFRSDLTKGGAAKFLARANFGTLIASR